MTPERFATLSALLDGTPGVARAAARMVLVDGISQAEAVRRVQCSQGAVSRMLTRLRALDAQGCPTCGRAVAP